VLALVALRNQEPAAPQETEDPEVAAAAATHAEPGRGEVVAI
jgi:hypothetical protein